MLRICCFLKNDWCMVDFPLHPLSSHLGRQTFSRVFCCFTVIFKFIIRRSYFIQILDMAHIAFIAMCTLWPMATGRVFMLSSTLLFLGIIVTMCIISFYLSLFVAHESRPSLKSKITKINVPSSEESNNLVSSRRSFVNFLLKKNVVLRLEHVKNFIFQS